MSRIFWDTNLFIYLIEGSGERSDAVLQLRERMLARNDVLFTSTLTLGEVLVKPIEENEPEIAAQYEKALTAGATILTFDVKAARAFAAIRKDRSIRPPDAIQLACAAEAKVDLFITNDDRLRDKIVPGIQFVTSLHRAFL
ncbi:MAG: type II toxin-antitoxin system VapC family toxin [Vicinamibacteria bacterium]